MAKQKTAEDLTNDESVTVTDEESLAKIAEEKARAKELAAQRAREKANLDAQDPIVYVYDGAKAQAGESLIGVPLADLRQSTWAELPKWMQASVAASHLYTKVEAK